MKLNVILLKSMCNINNKMFSPSNTIKALMCNHLIIIKKVFDSSF